MTCYEFRIAILSLFAIVLHIFLGCNNQNVGTTDTINIEDKNKLLFNEHFDKLELIPLEKNENSLINNATKHVFHNGSFYVFDRFEKALLVFTREGKFKFKIKNEGRGPSEYILLSDFDINPYSGNIELLSPYGFIFTYDLNGNHIRTYKLPDKLKAVHNIGFLSENKIALYRKFEDLRIVVVDRIEDKILYKSHKVPKCLATSSSGRTFPFFYADNQLKLHEGFSNQIYIITEKKIVRDKFLDFGDKNIDLKKMPNSQNDQVKYRGWIREENHPKYIFPFKSNLEHGRYSLISYGANKDLRYLILDKNSDKYITFSGYEENIMFPHYGVTTWEKGYNVIVHPLILDWYVNSSVLDDKNLKVLRSVKKDDNPVVLKYYLNPSFTIK